MWKFILLLYVSPHLHHSEGKQDNSRLRLVIPTKARKSIARSLPRSNIVGPNQWQEYEVSETGIFNWIGLLNILLHTTGNKAE